MDLPIAVVDLETTGLHPAGDRVVEIAIVRRDPGREQRVVLDTLVNPGRRVAATEIHGITDRDVRDAPRFEELAPLVMDALNGAVFASYNVYFDARFIAAELARAGITTFPPHLCLMYMRPMLELGGRCSLADACREHGLPFGNAHVAAGDALAGAGLWSLYLDRMDVLQVRTFKDLATRKSYKFTKSFSDDLLDMPAGMGSRSTVRLKSRWDGEDLAEEGPVHETPQERRAEYWESLKAVLADLVVTKSEVAYLSGKQLTLDLSDAEIRSLHARAFAGLLADLTDDHVIDNEEVGILAAMADALRALGWFPGDHPKQIGGGPNRGWLSRVFRG